MGRNKEGVYSKEWSAPGYTVDADGKVVGGYQPGERSNWGRWGSDDRRGTANLITPDKVAAAAGLVKSGKVFSLAMPIDASVPTYPGRSAPNHYFKHSGSDVVTGNPLQATKPDAVIASDDGIDMNLQGSTQWDGLGHCQYRDTLYNGFWSGNVTAYGGDPALGIENMRESFVGRGILLDFPRFAGVDNLEPGTSINTKMLEEICDKQGVVVGPGDIVLIRTGHLLLWDPTADQAAKWEYFTNSPGVGASGISWFVDNDIAATASDTASFEVSPYENDEALAVHRAFLIDLGLTIGELWDLEALAEACADDGVYEFLLVAPPLYIPSAVGSPLNPIAIK
jgi:kynurenine formamidase